MFRKEFQRIDIDQAMHRAFEALAEFIAMQDVASGFNAAEQSAITKTQGAERKSGSLAIPAVGDVRGYCKTFAQRADHCAAALLAIVRLFYSDMKGEKWDDFRDMIKKEEQKRIALENDFA